MYFESTKDTLVSFYIKHKNMERRIKRKNGYLSDEIIYVIRIGSIYGAGLCNIILNVLEKLKYVDEKGYIPLIQVGDNYTAYNVYNKYGKFVNIWEKWFEQPSQYGFSDLAVADNIIFGEANINIFFLETSPVCFLYDRNKMHKVCELCSKYIKVRTGIIEEIERKYSNIFDKKVLGVSYRTHLANGDRNRGEYVMREGYWHPSLNETIKRTKKWMKTGEFDLIYLSTPEEKAVRAFKEIFGDSLVVMDRNRSDALESTQLYSELFSSKYEYGKIYLIDILLLSKCNALVAGIDCGTMMAMIFNDLRYELVDLFNVGTGSDYSGIINNKIIDWCIDNKDGGFVWTEYGNFGNNKEHINNWTK